ncbi:hypothetical protein J437_LFUL008282 [Ladona fulva]|uniref:tetrahydrofolate synthase n=1 Tax=Ladona fulva TaxID=123851 RepID=A0A8K0K5B3_LADFU|nr:hypothetical protein J437_LFUL008282 [Ladona fulva]
MNRYDLMRILLQKLTMVKGLQEAACVRSAAFSNYINPTGYREAVRALNLLQTNASVLQEARKKREQGIEEKRDKLLETYKYLSRSGVSLEQLDSLPIIHVAGTKGKGSTCAFCESVLRHWAKGSTEMTWKKRRGNDGMQAIRTGLYTSPHLVEVRERIQLNGKPISQELFAFHFWDVYNALMEKRDHEHDMPPYFKFLTVLAFNVFIKEGVDVAIIEVGIGGEYDCTNIISILGTTLGEIAWQKAGILKKGSAAFTSFGQDLTAMTMLEDRAKEKEVLLKVCPPLSSYSFNGHSLTKALNLRSKVQEVNASLALQLANEWICWAQNSDICDHNVPKYGISMAQPFEVNTYMFSGIKKCSWPGRLQILHLPNITAMSERLKLYGSDFPFTFFLDGAHTSESIQVCIDWFTDSTHSVDSCMKCQDSLKNGSGGNRIDHQGDTMRILLFNTTGDRNVEMLLSPLARSNLFHMALFSTNSPTSTVDPHSDLTNFSTYQDQQKMRCEEHLKVWMKYNKHIPGHVFACVFDALSHLEKLPSISLHKGNRFRKVHVLVSGSLHLVGSVMSILDPDLSSFHSSGESISQKSEPNIETSLKSTAAEYNTLR